MEGISETVADVTQLNSNSVTAPALTNPLDTNTISPVTFLDDSNDEDGMTIISFKKAPIPLRGSYV